MDRWRIQDILYIRQMCVTVRPAGSFTAKHERTINDKGDIMDTTPKKLNLKLAIVASILVLGGACVLTSCGGGSSGASSTVIPAVDVVLMHQEATQFIEKQYPESAKARAALTQYVEATIAAAADANDTEKSLQHGSEVNNAFQCLNYTLGSADAAYAEAAAFEDAVISGHDDRMTAYTLFLEKNAVSNAYLADSPNGLVSTCQVNPDTLPN